MILDHPCNACSVTRDTPCADHGPETARSGLAATRHEMDLGGASLHPGTIDWSSMLSALRSNLTTELVAFNHGWHECCADSAQEGHRLM